MDPVLVMALIGALGIGAQWVAWRISIPAIVLMLAAGLVAGPATGLIDPQETFGDLLRPAIAIAVAVILFEGGLTLDFRELRGTGQAVRRLVYVGAPLAWLLSTAAIHWGAGLSLEASAVFGGILIVTGPTVVTPLLRQAKLAQRPAGILRWEAIINDPVGALAAVLAFELVATLHGSGSLGGALWHLAYGIAIASVAGWIAGRFIAWSFSGGKVPEYMKVPVLFGAVLVIYAATDTVLHESGLLAVTVMGIVIANAHLPSLTELRRFKEHVTVILVSGVFILLAASLEREMIATLDWRAVLFVFLVVFLARPLAVWLALIGTDLSRNEKIMIGWIGPRGVVAVAVAGLFGQRLVEEGVADGGALAPLAFALVAATVVLHGFSLAPLARVLGLTSKRPPGLIIVGASRWSIALAKALKSVDIPVLIADSNYYQLRIARREGLLNYHGEILSEAAEHTLPFSHYGMMLAATPNDYYNALICTDFGPEFGRTNVYQIGRHEAAQGERDMPATIGGRTFAEGASYESYASRMADGWDFAITNLTEEYGLEEYRADRPDLEIVGIIRKSGALEIVSGKKAIEAGAKDAVLGFRRKPKEEAAVTAGERGA